MLRMRAHGSRESPLVKTAVADDLALLRDATFITADADRDAAVVFHTAAQLDQDRSEVSSAVAASTGLGIYELSLDGAPVSEDLFAPGWTSYEWRLQYQRYDVTEQVRTGPGQELEISALVGNGWYRGDFGFGGANSNYGEEIGVLAALRITYRDGATQVIGTSAGWAASTCDVVEHSIYHGQRIDARLRTEGTTALTVRAGSELDPDRLTPQIAEGVRRHEVLAPEKIWTSPSGKTLVDFGQNLVGWVRVRAEGPAGTEIVLRHAEVLENDELGTRPLRSARATDTFVLSGEGVDTFEPTFTFHGFRYAEVSGWPGELRAEDLEAVVVHSAIRRTFDFECSEPLVNQLVHNSVWGQKGNFLAVPTDCPQRDERLGWTGDIAAYAATSAFQFDVSDFLHNWLLDLAEEGKHDEHGYVPVIVPNNLKPNLIQKPLPFLDMPSQAVWADAAAWVPEALWNAYGDRDRLAAHYPGMVGHVESVIPLLSETGLWDEGFQLADWLDPDAPPDDPAAAKADTGVVATASFYRSVAFTEKTARELGLTDDAARWAELAQRLRAAFREHYVADERVTSDCATVYALAICFGLLEENELGWAAGRLAELVAERDYRVTTGFAGTPFVTWALSENGHADVAYKLLLEKGCPSWLYPITMGATTIWERWDSMLPDGSINPGEMTSFNHYALGAVADWIYQVVAGIRAAEPGYRRIRIQPVPGEGIDWARTGYDSRVGRIETAWRNEGGQFTLEVTIPEGVPADVVLPDGTTHEVTGGTHTFTA